MTLHKLIRRHDFGAIVPHLIDTIMSSDPGYALCPENRKDGVLTLSSAAVQVIPKRFRYLFDTKEILTTEFYSRTALKDSRAAYIVKNISDYYTPEKRAFSKAIVLIETTEEFPLGLSEFKPLQASIGRITGSCEHTCFLFGKSPSLGHDIHVLIVLSR